MTLQRISHVIAGYDHHNKPCKPGCSHGIACEYWFYIVTDGEIALTFDVVSGLYPASIGESYEDSLTPDGKYIDRPDSFKGGWLGLHVGFPLSRKQLVYGEDDDGNRVKDCEWVKAKRCFQGSNFVTSLGASELLTQLKTQRKFEQYETWWLGLEAKWHEWSKEAYALRADTKWEKCKCCDGFGSLEKK